MDRNDVDEILGITRCARCGHRLEGDIECPLCSSFPDPPQKGPVPRWVYITACFLTSPLSLYAIITTSRMNKIEKVMASSGCILWLAAYRFLF